MLPLIGLIPLLPLVGFLVCGLFGKRLPKGAVAGVACGSVLLAFLLSVGAVVHLVGTAPERVLEARATAHSVSPTSADEALALARSYTVSYWTWLPAMHLEEEPDPDTGRQLEGHETGARTHLDPEEWPDSWAVPAGVRPDFQVDFGFLLDPLSAVMILVITGVGFLIHVYSIGYMAHDAGFARYFSYLNLFTAMMLTLVLGSNSW